MKALLNEIKKSIEELQSIYLLVDEQLEDFNKKNALVEKQLNELKNIQKEYKKENNKRNESIKQSLRQSRNNNYDNKNNNINDNNGPDLDNIPITQSFLIKPKGSKEELYKTTFLFSKEEDVDEESLAYGQLLEKNWHEICYVYDDYDIYDVYYILKAVGLSKNSSFKNGAFSLKSNSEVELFTINGVKTNYKQIGSIMMFEINLKNLHTAKIHIKFKHIKSKGIFFSGRRIESPRILWNFIKRKSKINR